MPLKHQNLEFLKKKKDVEFFWRIDAFWNMIPWIRRHLDSLIWPTLNWLQFYLPMCMWQKVWRGIPRNESQVSTCLLIIFFSHQNIIRRKFPLFSVKKSWDKWRMKRKLMGKLAILKAKNALPQWDTPNNNRCHLWWMWCLNYSHPYLLTKIHTVCC